MLPRSGVCARSPRRPGLGDAARLLAGLVLLLPSAASAVCSTDSREKELLVGTNNGPTDGVSDAHGATWLAIAFEAPRNPLSAPTLVIFFDVSNPEAPTFASGFAPTNTDGDPLTECGFVGVTPLPRVPEEAKNRYLMVVTGGSDPEYLFFYRSTPDGLSSSALSWESVGTAPYPSVSDAHQTMQFLREGSTDGDLYLAGIRSNANMVLHDDHDRIDLYYVECQRDDHETDPNCEPGDDILVTVRFNGRRISPLPSTGGTRLVNLAAASGFYVSPNGELIMYATEHDNDGPDGTVKAGEWRHIDIVRAGSPALLPTIRLNGPFEVDERGSIDLRGRAEPPIIKPWIQLFHEVDFGGPNFSTFYPVVDFDDYDLDDFDSFFALELQVIPPATLFTHNDKARSWNWFAPVGCSSVAIDYNGGVVDEARTLVGTGVTERDPDLSQVLNDGGTDDIDQDVDAVEFLADCDEYYTTKTDLQWDLDRDLSYGQPDRLFRLTRPRSNDVSMATRFRIRSASTHDRAIAMLFWLQMEKRHNEQ